MFPIVSVLFVLAILLLAGCVLVLLRRLAVPAAGGTAALDDARAEIGELRTRLAVEGERGNRLPALQRELDDVRTRHLAAVEARSRAVEEAATVASKLGAETRRAAELGTRLDTATRELDASRRGEAASRAEIARLRETIEQETARADEKLALLAEARREMGDQFRVLAEEVMTRHGEGFARLNKEQIDGILSPLKERLGAFEQAVQHSQTETTRERATLGQQIRQLADMGSTMEQRTRDLTEALRGRSQMQGAWGEMVLASILEKCGLRLGEEYSTQRSFTGAEGERLRPDVLIHLPGRQDLVVDSKVSLVAFAELCREDADEASRTLARRRHVDSVRGHVAALGNKNYQTLTGGGLDYVLMFVPIEGALAAAIAADPTLVNFALEQRVTLVTPTTLMVALRTVHSVWQVERRHRNADDIADRAGKLYDKFAGFVSDLSAVRDSLDKSRTALDGAMNKLTSGRGNLLTQAEKLRQMGAKTTKSLPPALLTQLEEHDLAETALSGDD